jgi:hypothetical protein
VQASLLSKALKIEPQRPIAQCPRLSSTNGRDRADCPKPLPAGVLGPADIQLRSQAIGLNGEVDMATMYLVQAFKQVGKKLVADPVIVSKGSDKAIATAERLAPMRAGVLAFSQDVDVETDTYDEPRVLLRIGTLPPGLME